LTPADAERIAPNSEAGRLLTPERLADRWSIAKPTIYAHTREGRIPAVRIGRLYRYRLEEIEAFEAAGGMESDG
jgi:excisionase family DNA binding protein